jgi:High-temperature-induced dauer-formation protein
LCVPLSQTIADDRQTLKYNPASWRVPYNALVFKDPKQILVTYTLQFLLVTVLYPIPEQPGVVTPKNFYRHFLGRLHRPQDFQFIVDGMTRILNQPLQANASYIPGTQPSVRFAPEIIMLFWEITQCNKRFRSFIIDTERAHDFVILVLFYALEYKGDASKQGVVRMCAFLLQTLSVETNFGLNLNKSFEAQDTLPPAIRITGFKGTYADFLIQVRFVELSPFNQIWR